jgi:hypothetical protein
MFNRPGTIVQVAAITTGILCLLVYLQSLSCGFINLDDPYYITNNPLIKRLDAAALYRIFTEAHLAAWLPLTYASFAVDFYFWGNNPAGYHLTNSLLHAANACLVVILADRLCRERLLASIPDRQEKLAYFGFLLISGCFFALHPLRVESVAWAAERKDVLNGLFTIATILAYLAYARKRSAGDRQHQLPLYLLALMFFILSLLAKQVSVTLPVILLLLDWYPLRRIGTVSIPRLLVEKIPFWAVALLITAVTIYFAVAENKLASMQAMPLYVRILVSGNAVFEYCRLTLFPIGISPYCIIPKPLPYSYLVHSMIVAALTLFVLRNAKRRPMPAATWFAFVAMLLPTLAFVQAGDDIALAARYTYLPGIVAGISAAAVLTILVERLRTDGRRYVSIFLPAGIVICLIVNVVITSRLISVWKDTGSFWSRVIEINPVGRAYGDRGVFYLIKGRSAEAADDFTVAIGIANDTGLKTMYNLYAFRAVALSDLGRFPEAVVDFDRAIALFPHQTYFQLRGVALQSLGRLVEAEQDFRRAGPNPPPIDWF